MIPTRDEVCELTTAREVMNPSVTHVASDSSAADVARLMTEQDVGALPICGPDNKIKGLVTDRDLVVKVVGAGRDAGTFPAGDLNQREAVTVGAEDSVEDALATMTRQQVRRLPVIDNSRPVGMISLSDLARQLPHSEVGELVDALSSS